MTYHNFDSRAAAKTAVAVGGDNDPVIFFETVVLGQRLLVTAPDDDGSRHQCGVNCWRGGTVKGWQLASIRG
jgi:hypothetical protein